MKHKKGKRQSDDSTEVDEGETERPARTGIDESPAADGNGDSSLRAELEEAREHWKRALADYQNLRKRTLADIESAVRRSKTELLGEALIVLDYLEMALATPVESAEGQNLLAGVRMTRDQMLGFLQNQGVTPLASEGAFDPELHQAFETVDDSGRPPGTIVSTVRRGYKLGDSVLRHAQVRVAAAPGAATESPAE